MRADRRDETARGEDAAVEDPLLLLVGPPLAGDRFACEVDDRARAVESLAHGPAVPFGVQARVRRGRWPARRGSG